MEKYIFGYQNENEFKKLESALKKYNMLAFKKLYFEYYPKIKAGEFLGTVVAEEGNLKSKTFKITAVSWGNPHCVMFLDSTENMDEFDVEKYGKVLEVDKAFPNKTNVEFIQIVDKNHVKMRVWERGAGETLACGTGACATAVACYLNGKTDRNVEVELLGGKLYIEWNEENNHIYMTGPAVTVFEGMLDYE